MRPLLALLLALAAAPAAAVPLELPTPLERKIRLQARAYEGAARRWVERAGELLASENYAFAAFAMERARKLAPEPVALRVSLGEVYNRIGRHDDALALASAGLETHAGEPGLHRVLGSARLAKGETARAIAAFQAAIALEPGEARGHRLLGDALLQQGERERALESYDAALARDPSLSGVRVRTALLLVEAGRLPEGAARAARAVELDPEDAWARLALATAYRAQGDSASAERAYRRAIELRPGWLYPYDRLASLYVETGQNARAIEVTEALLERMPDHLGAHEELVRLYQRAGQQARFDYHMGSVARLDGEPDAAIERYRSAVERDPELGVAWLDWARVELGRRRLAPAASLAAEALAHGGAGARVHSLLGRVHLAQGDRAAAERAYRSALEVDPDHAPALVGLAGLLAASERCVGALELYVRALERAPGLAPAWRAAGTCHRRLGQMGKAERAYLRAMAADPGDAEALRRLASLYVSAEGNREAALYLARRAAVLEPGSARSLYVLGRAQYAAGRYGPAAESLEAAARIRPDSPAILYQLGAARYELGELEAARSRLERALELDPEAREAQGARSLLEQIAAGSAAP